MTRATPLSIRGLEFIKPHDSAPTLAPEPRKLEPPRPERVGAKAKSDSRSDPRFNFDGQIIAQLLRRGREDMPGLERLALEVKLHELHREMREHKPVDPEELKEQLRREQGHGVRLRL